ncbi:MAG: hypothetical protein WCA22_05150, partial [Candidatus Binatus sp.]
MAFIDKQRLEHIPSIIGQDKLPELSKIREIQDVGRSYKSGSCVSLGVCVTELNDFGPSLVAQQRLYLVVGCTSSEPIGQVGTGIKRGSGPSELNLWLRTNDAAGVWLRWFS